MSVNSISYVLPSDLEKEVQSIAKEWTNHNFISRIWQRDATIWTNDDEAKWLGWLDIAKEEQKQIETYRRFHAELETEGFKHVVVLGMGGSSLCSEVLSKIFGIRTFHILDSTVPSQIKHLQESIPLPETLFIVASKSGSTLEPNCFMHYFFDLVRKEVGSSKAGRHFAAITDPGSSLEKTAKDLAFRQIFFGKTDVGGRFSALSAFGLAAGAAMGLDINILLSRANQMVDICKRSDALDNPGALLGLVLGICHNREINKLTIFTSQKLKSIGAWLEQLIAESTGKNGKAIIPVDGEPVISADHYGNDRLFVYIGLRGEKITGQEYDLLSELESNNRPVIRIEVETEYHISQEFFRWEFATAVAGALMKINPFNQPDVESAKVEAKKLTDLYEKTGKLSDEYPFFSRDVISLFTNETNQHRLESIAGSHPNLKKLISAHLSQLNTGDYFALLSFLEMSDQNMALCNEIRRVVLERTGNATCLGFGPRFLHSTGQAYKGGPNTGVFLQITADDEFDLPVPGQKFTFGVVKSAQARGDFQVLLDRHRRALRVHIAGSVADGLSRLLDSVRG
ncbi:MAG: bifunctional transaldolase/phosoglucose isomerase [Pyrinomonadaceae bacterium]